MKNLVATDVKGVAFDRAQTAALQLASDQALFLQDEELQVCVAMALSVRDDPTAIETAKDLSLGSDPSLSNSTAKMLAYRYRFTRSMIFLSILWLELFQAAFIAAADFRSYDILPSISDVRKLKVGQELSGEQLALQRGQCIYVLQGLELAKSYEVKISYPASIPASFTIELLKEGSFQATRGGRRLLNTEKLMFRADESQGAEVYDGMPSGHVLVTVESTGVVAKPYTKDHTFVIFNILCEEVKFGIPLQAWWIALLGAAAILISALAPMLLPPHLLPRKGKEPCRKPTS